MFCLIRKAVGGRRVRKLTLYLRLQRRHCWKQLRCCLLLAMMKLMTRHLPNWMQRVEMRKRWLMIAALWA